MGHELGFDSLIAPVSVDEFFATNWERQPLHVPGQRRDRFDGLVSVEDVETIAATALNFTDGPSTVLAARCTDGEPDYWDIPFEAGANKAIHALLHAFASGYSIVVNSIDRFWAPLASLCRSIESELQHPVGANLYYSPADTQGFPAHFDKHDVIIGQVAGEKLWDVYEPEPGARTGAADPWMVPQVLDAPALQATLAAGDVLYLPRGWAHRVKTGRHPSLHITLGVRSLSWADLVMRAADAAVRADADLQLAIPLHEAPTAAEINRRVADMLGALALPEEADPFRALMAEVHETRPASLAHHSAQILAAEDGLSPSSVLRRRPRLRPAVTRDGDEVTIRFSGNGLNAHASFLGAFELLTEQTSVTLRELSEAVGADAGPLARALIINGLLTIDAESRDGSP